MIAKLEKYTIPSGSIILMSQYVMHRNPLYFPDPNTFYPDRWTDEFKKNLPRFTIILFGGGIRSCGARTIYGWKHLYCYYY